MTFEKNKTLNLIWEKRLLFCLIALTFVLYIYRSIIALNVEIVFIFIFILCFSVLFKVKKYFSYPKSLLIWSALLFFYWASNYVSTYMHPLPGNRALGILNVVNLSLFFLVLTLALYRLKLNLNFFWYLILMGSFVALSFGALEAYQYGWFDSGIGEQRLGQLNSNALNFAIIVNGFFVVLLGALPWANKKNKVYLLFVISVILGLLVLTILTKSRTAWLGWPEAIIGWGLFYLYLLKVRYPKMKYLKTKVILFYVIFIFALMQFDFIKKPLIDRGLQTLNSFEQYMSGESMKSSLGHRLLSNEVALNKIPEVFWFGIGEDAFTEFLETGTEKLALERFNQKIKGFNYLQIHNQFLMSLLTKGFIVFASVIFLVAFLIIFFACSIKRVSDEYKPVAIAGLVFSSFSFLSFLPATPLLSTSMSIQFFLLSSLLIIFTLNGRSSAKNR